MVGAYASTFSQSLFFAQNKKNVDLSKDLYSYNKLDEVINNSYYLDAINSAYDAHPFGTNGTFSSVQGLLGNACSLYSNKYLLVGPDLATSNIEFSISFWVKFHLNYPDNNVRICAAVPGSTNTNGILFFFNTSNGMVQCGWVNATNTGYTSLTDLHAPPLNTWINYTCTVRKVGNYSYLDFYVNSVKTKTIESTIYHNLNRMLTYRFNIPANFGLIATTTTIYDDIKMWERCLTQDEIDYNYNNGNGRALGGASIE